MSKGKVKKLPVNIQVLFSEVEANYKLDLSQWRENKIKKNDYALPCEV